MLHCFWDKTSNRCKSQFLFWAIFYPFTLRSIQKIKTFKKWKNTRWYHFTHVHHKWQSYDAWFLRHGARQTEYFVFLDCFLHFYPSNKLKNQTFEKMKTISEDIIILHMPTVNENHMMLTLWPFFMDGVQLPQG